MKKAKKRAASEDDALQLPETKRVKTRTKQEHATDNNLRPFRFSDLPAELRNHVYGYVIVNNPTAYLKPPKSGKRNKLFSTCALARTNRQIRDELTSLLYLAAPRILVGVTNFSFAHIVTFFNNLDEIDLQALPTTVQTSDRKMIISLAVHQGVVRHRAKLQTWLNRLNHPTKNGAGVAVEYEVEKTVYVQRYSVHLQFEPIIRLERNAGGPQWAALECMRKKFKAHRRWH